MNDKSLCERGIHILQRGTSADSGLNKVVVVAMVAALLAVAGLAYLYFQPTTSATVEFAGRSLTVELAKTTSQQEKGLSGRDSMAPDHGMLFIFDHASKWSFWMQGMEFPLDIIWFDSNKSAIYFVQGLAPCTPNECQVYAPPSDALYALEVNAGFVTANNVTLGKTFTLGG